MKALQLVTGMRPGEAVIMRGCDIDTDRLRVDLTSYGTTPQRGCIDVARIILGHSSDTMTAVYPSGIE